MMQLQPGQKVPFFLDGVYLICRKVSGAVAVVNTDRGLPETRLYQSDIVDFTGKQIDRVYLVNLGSEPAEVLLQSSSVKILSNDGGAVTIQGGSIDSIRESIQVTAQATVNDGSMTSLSPNAGEDGPDIVINPGQAVTVAASNPTARRRTVIIQNVSDEFTVLRVGANPSAVRGLVLPGSMAAPGAVEMDFSGQVRVFNTSASPAKVALFMGVR